MSARSSSDDVNATAANPTRRLRAPMKLKNEMVVRIPSPTFFSVIDEELFFIGLRLVGSVRAYEGVGRFLEIHLDARPSKRDERDFAALLSRYRIRIARNRASKRGRGAVDD